MKFQNKTIYNRAVLEKLNRVVGWVVGKNNAPLNRVLLGVLPIVLVGTGFYVVQEQGFIPIAVVELAVGGFLLIWIPFRPKIQAWISSSIMVKGSPEYTLDFFEDGYVVSSTTMYGAPTSQTPYRFWRLCETPDYLVLLLDKRSGYVLDKAGFTLGDASSFQEFLTDKAKQSFEAVPL